MYKNFDLINMNNIEKFVRENQENLNNSEWEDISKNINLTENFIREFKENVDWFYISSFQDLSEDFLIEFKNRIYWNDIRYNKNISLSKSKNFAEKFNTK